jgi:hypothetical protein
MAMPAAVQAKMESAFGVDFSAVRIHPGSQAAAIGALAFTRGTDIHFAPGQYRPHEGRGQEILGHELAHVVQQSQGRVHATTQAMGLAINDDPALEREADEKGRRAAAQASITNTGTNTGTNAGPAPGSARVPATLSRVSQAVTQRCDPVDTEQTRVTAEKPSVSELEALTWGETGTGRAISKKKLGELIDSVNRSIKARKCVGAEHGGANAGHALRIQIETALQTSAQNEWARREQAETAQKKTQNNKQNVGELAKMAAFLNKQGATGGGWAKPKPAATAAAAASSSSAAAKK